MHFPTAFIVNIEHILTQLIHGTEVKGFCQGFH